MLLTEHEAAKELKISIVTLRRYRRKKIGPNYVKYPKAIFYKLADIEAWIDSLRVELDKTGEAA